MQSTIYIDNGREKEMLKKLFSIVLCFALCLTTVGVMPALEVNATEGDLDYEYISVSGYQEPEGINVETISWADRTNGLSWTLDASLSLMSGNTAVGNSDSVLKITVTGSGALAFQYMVSSSGLGSGSGQESNPDSLFIVVGRDIAFDADGLFIRDNADYRFYGSIGWTNMAIPIIAEDDAETSVYFIYSKNGKTNAGEDLARIKALEFRCGTFTVTPISSDETYGTVSVVGDDTVAAGMPVSVKAQTKTGGTFFGWQQDGSLVSTDTTYTFPLNEDTEIKAIFGNADAVEVKNPDSGDIFYSVIDALSQAQSGDRLMLMKDVTINENVTVPSGVTFYIPYSNAFDADGSGDGTSSDSSVLATSAKTFRTLTNNASITVNGTLRIGAVIGRPGQDYQGHTSGWHGKLVNNGTVTVGNGGTLDAWGYLEGGGSVEALSGATVFEPFIVYDFSGGNNTASLYLATNSQCPFVQYSMQNISCELVVRYGAKLKVHCNLYASSAFNKTDAYWIGVGANGEGHFKLEPGATLVRTIDKSKTVPIASGSSLGSDIGRVTYEITGDATIDVLSMTLLDLIDVTMPYCPITYNEHLILKNGDFTLDGNLYILPGGELTVDTGATLNVNAKLYALNGLRQSGMSGKTYPTTELLASHGYATNGVLIVNGELNIGGSGTFGGIVQTKHVGATVQTGYGATLSTSAFQFGGRGSYDDNTSIMPLDAQLRVGTEVVNMTRGSTYIATSTEAWTLPGYEVTSYTTSNSQPNKDLPNDGLTTAGPLTVTTNQTMHGSFSSSQDVTGIEMVNRTYYDANDASRVEISVPTVTDGVATFTVAKTAAGSAYNLVIQVAEGSAAPVQIRPNASGVCTVEMSSPNITVTVTAVLKGDVSLNGAVAANDVTLLRRALAGYEDFANIFAEAAADCSGNGAIAANDVTLLRRFLAGYTDTL